MLYEKALKIAASAHKNQVRKHDGSPYIVHPVMVAHILSSYNFPEEVIAAGLVHDVLEDSELTEEVLREELGDVVTDIVTAVSEQTDLPWEERKQKYVQDVVSKNESVWAVSVADKVHNAQNLTAHYEIVGSSIWENFNRGKEKKIWFEELLHTELSKVWRHPLLDRYKDLIEQMRNLPD